MRAATTQINSTIKHILIMSAISRSKFVANTNSGIPIYGIPKPQMKLELKDSRDIHWENFKLSLDPGLVFKGCQLLPLKLTKVGGFTKRLMNQKLRFQSSLNLTTFHKIYLRLILVSFLSFPSFYEEPIWYNFVFFSKSNFQG